MFEKASVFCPCFENSADKQLWPNEIRRLADITRVSTLSTWGDAEASNSSAGPVLHGFQPNMDGFLAMFYPALPKRAVI